MRNSWPDGAALILHIQTYISSEMVEDDARLLVLFWNGVRSEAVVLTVARAHQLGLFSARAEGRQVPIPTAD